MSYKDRKELPFNHLFDGIDLNVYDTKVINLSAGTPGVNLLRDCSELFKIATDHRMVRVTTYKQMYSTLLTIY